MSTGAGQPRADGRQQADDEGELPGDLQREDLERLIDDGGPASTIAEALLDYY